MVLQTPLDFFLCLVASLNTQFGQSISTLSVYGISTRLSDSCGLQDLPFLVLNHTFYQNPVPQTPSLHLYTSGHLLKKATTVPTCSHNESKGKICAFFHEKKKINSRIYVKKYIKNHQTSNSHFNFNIWKEFNLWHYDKYNSFFSD